MDARVSALTAALAVRLRSELEKVGNVSTFAKTYDLDRRALNRYLHEGVEPSLSSLIRLSEALDVSISELIYGSDAPLALASGQGVPPDYVQIPRFDVRASAGAGLVAVAPEIEQHAEIAFRTSWLRSLGVQPEHAQFLTAEGDSMMETIRDGDLLLINRLIDRVVNDAIYVIVLAGAVMVKRLQLLFDGSILLISDNPRYQPERLDKSDVERLQVEGRVRWYGRAI